MSRRVHMLQHIGHPGGLPAWTRAGCGQGGLWVGTCPLRTTPDPAAVTCKACRRTRGYREAAD